MLELAHRGYEYQDLICAIRLIDLLLGRAAAITIDHKRSDKDRFDDLTIGWPDNRTEHLQLKHRENDGPLTLDTFTSDKRRCLLSKLVLSVVGDPADASIAKIYRLVVTDASSIDPILMSALRPSVPDPGPFIPGATTQRYQFDPSAVWPPTQQIRPAGRRTSRGKDVWIGVRDGSITREQLESFCAKFIIETGGPPGSLDLHNPGPAERILLQRIIEDVGVGIYPNQDRRPVDTADALLSTVRAARNGKITLVAEEIRKRSGLSFGFGNTTPVQPIDPTVEVKRDVVANGLIEPIHNCAETGGTLVLLGPPGQGKSWACSRLADSLKSKGWLVASHHCYWNEDDPERELRVQGDVILGSLLHQLELQDSTLPTQHNPALAATSEKLNNVLCAIRSRTPSRQVALFVDGIDHITRVLGRVSGRTDPSSRVAESLARLSIPPGAVMIIACQPGVHAEPFRTGMSTELPIPPWTDAEIGQLATSFGVICEPCDESQDEDVDVTVRSARPLAESELAKTLIHTVAVRSAGNPLHATYLLRELAKCTGADDLQTTLSKIPQYAGTLESYYTHLLAPIDQGFAWLPEALAIMDFSVTRAELREIFPGQARSIERILALLAPVLTEKVSSGGIRIYHESFARFLLSRLSEEEIKPASEPILKWLVQRGEFTDSRAFRNIPLLLARLDQHSELSQRGMPDYVHQAVSAGFGAQAIVRNLRSVVLSAGKVNDWCTVTRCIELARAADTFDSERIEVLAAHASVPHYVLGRSVFEDRLLFEGHTVLPYRAGLLYCDSLDAIGENPPWKEYLEFYRRGRESDNTSYPDDDLSIELAYLVGIIRTTAVNSLSIARISECIASLLDRGAWRHDNTYEQSALIIATLNRGLTPGRIARIIISVESKSKKSSLALAFAELLYGRGAKLAARRWARYAVENELPPGRAHVIALLDRSLLPQKNSRDNTLLDLTVEIQTRDVVRLTPSKFRLWNDLVTQSSVTNLCLLDAVEAALMRPGWYHGFLRYCTQLARITMELIQGKSQEEVSKATLEAFRVMGADLSSSPTVPSSRILFLHSEIEAMIQRGLKLISDADWLMALKVLTDVSRELQEVSARSLHPICMNLVRKVALKFCTPARADKTLELLAIPSNSAELNFYREHAEGELYLARIAMSGNNRCKVKQHWEQAAKFLTAYGFRKDSTIYELLAGIETLSARGIEAARLRLAKLQALVVRAPNHEDGTIQYAVTEWWELLGKIDPTAAVSLLRQAHLERLPKISPRHIDAAACGIYREYCAQVDDSLAAAVRTLIDNDVEAVDVAMLRRLAESSWVPHEPLLANLIAKLEESGLGDRMVRLDAATLQDLYELSDNLQHGTLVMRYPKSDQRYEYAESMLRSIEKNYCPDLGTSTEQIEQSLRVWASHSIWTRAGRQDAVALSERLGWRVLMIHTNGDEDAAIRCVQNFADVLSGEDAGRALSNLGMGFERHGASDLAALAYVLAFTKSRAGGGWLNFGDEDDARWVVSAMLMNKDLTRKILVDEVTSLLDSWRYKVGGSSRAFISLCSVLSESGLDVTDGFKIWDAAYDVISSRLLSTAPNDDPDPAYTPSVGRGDLSEVFLDVACIYARHPSRDKKRQSLWILARGFSTHADTALKSVLKSLPEIQDESTLCWILQLVLQQVQALSRTQKKQCCRNRPAVCHSLLFDCPYFIAPAIIGLRK